jgi:hypothetical protein
MKNKIFLINFLFVFVLFWCTIDESIEKDDKSQTDYDDMNVINKIWDQSIDKAIKLINTKTKAS